jgi:ubiquinone/menaquinone biosynthesis C-methylase UbiE
MTGAGNERRKMTTIAHGNYTSLAKNYSAYRPGYSELVLKGILSFIGKHPGDIDFVDVGAGTGIWTRMVSKKVCRITAVEPNNEMRKYGIRDSEGTNILWIKGTAESTGLSENSADLITMASSFHWTDFDRAVKEFYRVLRSEGWFAALWNPRLVELNPMLVEIENKLKEIVPDLKRVSSGRSEFSDNLTERLLESGKFIDVNYMEATHLERMTPERYIGIWESVNDVRVQAGPKKFAVFLDYIRGCVQGHEYIDATYLTRAWVAKKNG